MSKVYAEERQGLATESTMEKEKESRYEGAYCPNTKTYLFIYEHCVFFWVVDQALARFLFSLLAVGHDRLRVSNKL